MDSLMDALVFHQYGSPSLLKPAKVPTPVISKPTELIVKVTAAGVTHGDIALCNGSLKLFTWNQKMPLIPGFEYSGTVSNPGQTKFKLNDNVYGLIQSSTGNGSFAEYVKVDAEKDIVLYKPDVLKDEDAGGATVAGIAAYTSVFEHGEIKDSSKRVCVIGAVGAIGSFAVQFAKSTGSTVTAICAKADEETARVLGADETFDYQALDFKERIKEKQFDVVVDTVGGRDYYDLMEPLITDGGVYSTQAGDDRFLALGEGSIFWSLLKSTIKAPFKNFNSRTRYKMFFDAPKDSYEKFNELLASGKVKPFVNHKFSLQDGMKAVQQLETKMTRGKIVIVP